MNRAPVVFLALTSLLVGSHLLLPPSVPASLRTETFVVRCYDVGRSALAGENGIVQVGSGWQGGKEVNTVTYDPERVSREAIEARLQRAGTYLGTLGAASSPTTGDGVP